MKYKFRAWLQRFMYGRYGPDEFYRALVALYFIVMVVNLFVRSKWLSIFCALELVYTFFRVFSRKREARVKENRWFMKWWTPVRIRMTAFAKNAKDKASVWRVCPRCGAVLRLPRRKGKHTVRCPHCSERFQVIVMLEPKKK